MSIASSNNFPSRNILVNAKLKAALRGGCLVSGLVCRGKKSIQFFSQQLAAFPLKDLQVSLVSSSVNSQLTSMQIFRSLLIGT
jgi:hypothetical protein